jgi:hypothetical protein
MPPERARLTRTLTLCGMSPVMAAAGLHGFAVDDFSRSHADGALWSEQ